MTDLTVSMIFQAQTPAARAELQRLAREMEKVGVTGRKVGRQSAQGAKEAEGALKRQGAAARQAGAATAQGAGIGAAGVANLTAQLNDIGVMLAAGQSPLQLAIQQGTQIGQVIGNRGAAGAVRALGAAFASMVSPVNLITIGLIGAGAAAARWLTGMAEDAPDAGDALDDLRDSVADYTRIVREALAPTQDLFEVYGTGTSAAVERMRALAESSFSDRMEDARRAVGTIADSIRVSLEDTTSGRDRDRTSLASQFFGPLALPELQLRGLDAGLPLAAEMEAQMEALRQKFAAVLLEADPAKFSAALDDLVAGYEATAVAAGGVSEENRRVLDGLRMAANETQKLAKQQQDLNAATLDASALRVYAATRAESARALADAEALKATLEEEARLRQLIAEYGEDSVQVAEARVQAERDAFSEALKSAEVSQDLKDRLQEAWDAAKGVASVDMAGNISLAANEADRLAANLARAMATPITNAMRDEDTVMSGNVIPRADDIRNQQTAVRNFNRLIAPRGGRGGGGGGGGGSAEAARGSLTALRQEAEDALRAMEIAVAGVQEKVRAGLRSTAEGTEDIAEAKRRAAEALAELIPQLQKANDASGPEAAAAVELWRARIAALVDQLPDVASDLKTRLKEGLSGAFEDFFADFARGKGEIEDLGRALEDLFARAAAQKLATSLVNPLIDSLFAFLPFAEGGVPGGDLSAHRNTVVDRPTLFDMGGRTRGLMGEAGPEAILPTRPAPGGGLGVLASGPDGQGILPLTRVAGGALGVRTEAFAMGGIPDSARRALGQLGAGSRRVDGGRLPDWRPTILDRPTFVDLGRTARSDTAPALSGAAPARGAPAVTINVNNTASGVEATATQRDDGEGLTIDVMVAHVEGQIAGNLAQGRGPIPAALQRSFGMTRTGR